VIKQLRSTPAVCFRATVIATTLKTEKAGLQWDIVDGLLSFRVEGRRVRICVGPHFAVLAYVLANRTLLKTGAAVATIAVKQPDGSLLTSRVAAEKDGSKPPM
jgi:hypothetical protein